MIKRLSGLSFREHYRQWMAQLGEQAELTYEVHPPYTHLKLSPMCPVLDINAHR